MIDFEVVCEASTQQISARPELNLPRARCARINNQPRHKNSELFKILGCFSTKKTSALSTQFLETCIAEQHSIPGLNCLVRPCSTGQQPQNHFWTESGETGSLRSEVSALLCEGS